MHSLFFIKKPASKKIVRVEENPSSKGENFKELVLVLPKFSLLSSWSNSKYKVIKDLLSSLFGTPFPSKSPF